MYFMYSFLIYILRTCILFMYQTYDMYYVSHVFWSRCWDVYVRLVSSFRVFLFLYCTPYPTGTFIWYYYFAIHLPGGLESCHLWLFFRYYVYSVYTTYTCYFLLLTEIVKQAYGQWLVYDEFNTLEFISRYCSWYMNFGGVTVGIRALGFIFLGLIFCLVMEHSLGFFRVPIGYLSWVRSAIWSI